MKVLKQKGITPSIIQSPPSNCQHSEIKMGENLLVCKKCLRVRFITTIADYFYFPNGELYFTKLSEVTI